jgi:AraC-like DNA-binding protein
MDKIFNLITCLTILQAIVYTFIFVLSKKRNTSLILLGIYLFTIVGPGLHFILDNFNIKAVFEFPTNFYLLSPPIFYLYTRSVLGVLKKKDYWHLLPGIVEFLFFTILFIYPEELARPFYKNILIPNKVLVFVALIPIYSVSYLVASIVILKKFKSAVKNFYSSYEEHRLNWIYITNFISIFLYVIDTTASLIIIKVGYEINTYMVITTAIAFIVYWISIYGLNQKNLLLEIVEENTTVPEIDNSISEVVESSIQENTIKSEEYEEKYNKIVVFVKETKIYKDKELNLFTIANLLQMPYREVSNVINKFANKNFNLFLNEFRVDEAKQLIGDDSSDKFNLTWIAEEVGFNSRSTFFAAFKAIAGMTPAEYKKSKRPQ